MAYILFTNSISKIYFSGNGEYEHIMFLEQVSIGSIILLCVVYGVIPAILEELYYRNLFVVYFENKSKNFIVYLSSILFAIAHVGIARVIMSFFLGYVLMKRYMNVFSLKEIIGLHMLYNVLLILYEYLIYPWLNSYVLEGIKKTQVEIRSNGLINLGLLFCLIAIYCLIKFVFIDKNLKYFDKKAKEGNII